MAPPKLTAPQVRQAFFDFFKSKEHTFVPSSSTIPYEDPTLLFTNAGMNQYKSIFLGTVEPHSELAKLKRAFNSQKCIRAGGKHNDLEDVGKDSYHHTFFEMLGNWSFGDYFKKEAIEWSWELLTDVLKLPKDRLYVTYFEGDSSAGLEPDLEAKQFWLDVGVAEDHILPGNAKDNFWEMGATGPCGPCSEIHYDRIGGRNAAHLVNQDDPDVLEIWNNVFIQFNREESGALKPLPAKHVDTGMGFERLVSVIQDVRSNYDTDVFSPIFKRIEELTGKRPSLMPVLIEQLGDTFPELKKRPDEIKEILDEEEESFSRTLDRGEKLFEQYASAAKEQGAAVLNGKDVWRLYDTYGFPVDLTRLMAEELGLGVNEAEFEAAQAASKEASKANAKKDTGITVKLDVHDLAALEKMPSVPKTDDSAKFAFGNIDATVVALYHASSFPSSTASIPSGAPFGILLDRTSFYAESGGQEYDTGNIVIDGAQGADFAVENVQSYRGYVLHVGRLKEGEIKVGDRVVSQYDELRRWPLRNNHTATHILNFGLREVLGDHIDQKGSLVAPTKLRFDFSHKAGVTGPELVKIEEMSKEWIRRNVRVYSKEMDLKEAHKIPGLRAVFGEAYPDPVRVVSLEFSTDEIAADIENPKWRGTSVEFCGGTHVARTGDIKDFVITEESGIAKGIRRIIAVTGHEAASVTRTADTLEARLVSAENATGKAKDAALKTLQVELGQADISLIRKNALRERLAGVRKAFDKEVKERETRAQKEAVEAVTTFFKEKPDEEAYFAVVPVDGNVKILQAVVLSAKKLGKAVYVFSADTEGGKVAHVNHIPESLRVPGFDGRSWAASVSEVIGGKAGGKEDGAQGVGTEVGKVQDAREVAEKAFRARM
ncbi:unnamed protein product [Peniophora sp. CBMAI 1063]|nr:unnamed protein product [Peniophora sp. CBMAI 1063]